MFMSLRASDGRLLWHFDNANYSYLSLSTTSNVVYIASQDGLSALNSNSGTMLYTYMKASDSDRRWKTQRSRLL